MKKKIKCVECGDYISVTRLKLVPNTEYCVTCLEDQEKQGGGTIRYRGVITETLSTGGEIETINLKITKTRRKGSSGLDKD